MSQIFPDVIDGTNVGGVRALDQTFPIGIEGQAGSDADADATEVVEINRGSEAVDAFGAASGSPLTALILEMLKRDVAPVYGALSAKGSTPSADNRKAAWTNLETQRHVRLRMTDSEDTAIHDALADSCDNANLLQNKQVAIVGLDSGKTKSELISAANGINSKRLVMVGPGVYDEDGVLQSGNFAAMCAAAEVSKNFDLSDDLDLLPLPYLSAIEKDTVGQPLIRRVVVSGVEQNDFEDLLQDGVSPLMPGLDGGVAISHLRMTFTDDDTFDALMTRMIVDESFVIVRDYCLAWNFLRRPNTATNRELLRSGVDTLLKEHSDWIKPQQGFADYQVSVTSSGDERQVIVHYKGQVIRGIQTVKVDADLKVPV